MTGFEKGDEVRLLADKYSTPIGTWRSVALKEGAVGEVTVANTYKLSVRFPDGGVYGGEGSHWVDKEEVEHVDPDQPKARKLGDVPEGMISPDDPGLAWLWEDAAKLAKQKQYCSQYDVLTGVLGIPGRERTFTVKTTIGGLEVSTKVKAKSKKLAEAQVSAILGGQSAADDGVE